MRGMAGGGQGRARIGVGRAAGVGMDGYWRRAYPYAYIGVVVRPAPVLDHRAGAGAGAGAGAVFRERAGAGEGELEHRREAVHRARAGHVPTGPRHGEFSPGSSPHRAFPAPVIDSRHWVRDSRGRGMVALRGGGGRRRARGPAEAGDGSGDPLPPSCRPRCAGPRTAALPLGGIVEGAAQMLGQGGAAGGSTAPVSSVMGPSSDVHGHRRRPTVRGTAWGVRAGGTD